MIVHHQKFDFRGKCLIEKVTIEAPFRLEVDFPNEACFIYFLNAKAVLNSPVEQSALSTGESVLLKCGSYFADILKRIGNDRHEILVFHLYPEVIRDIYRHELPSFAKQAIKPGFISKLIPEDTVAKFVDSLSFYFENPSLVSDELLELKIKELILLLVQTRNAGSILDLFAQLFTPRQVSLREVVQNHLFTGLSVDDLAKLCNMSVSTFKRSFQDVFSDSPANYIKRQRLEKARELLQLSTYTITEIAFETRFNDAAHLSRSFKAAFHCSPSAFRQAARSSHPAG